MRVNRKAARAGAKRAHVEIDLGHGAKAYARPLDSFEHKLVMAEARAEMNALLAGEPTQRTWASITKERVAAAKARPESEVVLFGWVHGVLLAERSVERLDGVEEIETDDDGEVIAATPLPASFEAFELLFADLSTEARFKAQAWKLEQIWGAEKNVSGPGPNGSGPVEANTAAPAATPATPAPEAASEAPAALSPSSANSAPSPAPSPEPPKANSPGSSPDPAASGASPG
jgi:hypothetical protein